MSNIPQYMEPVLVGEIMRGLGIGRVESSQSPAFKAGDLVSGLLGWQEYAVVDAKTVAKLPELDIPVEAHMGPVGMTCRQQLEPLDPSSDSLPRSKAAAS